MDLKAAVLIQVFQGVQPPSLQLQQSLVRQQLTAQDAQYVRPTLSMKLDVPQFQTVPPTLLRLMYKLGVVLFTLAPLPLQPYLHPSQAL